MQLIASVSRATIFTAALMLWSAPNVSAREPAVTIQELPVTQESADTNSQKQRLRNWSRSIPNNEFEFARMVYEGGYEWPRWRADWPDAEFHFSNGLKRLTRIDVSASSKVVALNDPELFDYPWLYVVEVGYWSLSDQERSNLREYLLRGGFLMVDDFHGQREWANFASIMRDVFPERRVQSLAQSSLLFNLHFDIGERQQIPGIRSVMNNRTWEKGGVNAGWFGILDDQERVMVAINFNQDIGDAWEHADDAIYPHAYTALAYRMGVNYVVYAMTH